jgi:hypothetical protein
MILKNLPPRRVNVSEKSQFFTFGWVHILLKRDNEKVPQDIDLFAVAASAMLPT